jgi:hypothetical protein
MVKKRRRGAKQAAPVMKVSKGQVNKERALSEKRRQERVLITWGIVILSLIILLFLLFTFWPKESEYTDFAKCLAKEGYTDFAKCLAKEGLSCTELIGVRIVRCKNDCLVLRSKK